MSNAGLRGFLLVLPAAIESWTWLISDPWFSTSLASSLTTWSPSYVTSGESSDDTKLFRVRRVASLSTRCGTFLVCPLSTCWEFVGFIIKILSNVTSLLRTIFLSLGFYSLYPFIPLLKPKNTFFFTQGSNYFLWRGNRMDIQISWAYHNLEQLSQTKLHQSLTSYRR